MTAGRTAKLDPAAVADVQRMSEQGSSVRQISAWLAANRGIEISHVQIFHHMRRGGERAATEKHGKHSLSRTPAELAALRKRRRELTELAGEARDSGDLRTYILIVAEERKLSEIIIRVSGAKRLAEERASNTQSANKVLGKLEELAAKAAAAAPSPAPVLSIVPPPATAPASASEQDAAGPMH